MAKLAGLALVTLIAALGPAHAQEAVSYEPNSCQKFASGHSEHETLYLRAACVAARAGVASPANGVLSQEEVLSILMLMSLRQTGTAHNS